MMPKNTKNTGEKPVKIPIGTNLNADPRLIKLERGLKEIAEFRFNTITRFPELRYSNIENWKRLDDVTLNTIVRRLRTDGIKHATRNRVWELLESDFSTLVNPIQEYFENLPKIQGDPIGALATTVDIMEPGFGKNKALVFRKYLQKWLVGTVANVFILEKCANHLCFILSGEQGTFKSTWIKNLCPPALTDYYVEGSLDPENKDSLLATTSNLIFNLDDYFAGISSRKMNEFKGFITKNKVKVRRPYSRFSEENPKICSFIASSNEIQFLYDSTGNRRFIPFEVNRIDIEKALALNIDEVWSHAYGLFQDGYAYWLEKEDQEELNKYIERFEVQSNEYEVLISYLRSPGEGESADADLTNAEILEYLNRKGLIKLSTRKLGEALRKAGFQRQQKMRNGRRVRAYSIIYKDESEVFNSRVPDSDWEESE